MQYYVDQGITAYQDLDARLSTLDTDLNEVQQRLTQLETETATQDDVAAVAEDVAALHTELQTVEADVDKRISQNEDDIAALQSTVSNLQSGVDTLQSALAEVDTSTQENSDALSTVRTDLDGLEAELNTVDATLSEKASATRVDAIAADVTALEQEFQATYADVATLLSQHDNRLADLEASTYTQDTVNKLVDAAERDAQQYTDETERDTQLGFNGFVSLMQEFFSQPTNFIKEWVRTNFATKDRVNHLEERLIEHEARTETRLANIERFTDRIYEDSEYEKQSELKAVQDAMAQNDIPSMEVQADGETWHCDLTVQPQRLGGGKSVTCVR